MRVEYVARGHVPLGGKSFPPGTTIPGDLLKGRQIGPWIRQGLIVLRGPGAEDAMRAYSAPEPTLPRSPLEALVRESQLGGGTFDREVDEAPLLEVDDDYGEALERAGHTVEDAVEAAAEGVDLENEAEVQAHLAEQPRRRRSGTRRR